MATIIRPTDRAEAAVRLPLERERRDRRPVVAPATESPPPLPAREPPALEAELAHLSKVAAASIADTERSLLEKAMAIATENAQRELERTREEARAEGYREGLAQGEQDGRRDWNEQVGRLEKLFDGSQELRAQILDQAEDKIVELVFEALSRLLGSALSNREGVAAAVRQVLAAAREQDRVVTIRLAPADFALLGGSDEGVPKAFRPGAAIVADPRVHLGGCLLDTPQGSIDGRLEIQLERLKNAILEARQGQRK